MDPNARALRERTADRLHSVAIRLLRRVAAVDRESGLSRARLSALSVLVFGGERTVSELASAEGVALPTMTRLVNALEADGYVRRSPDPSDGRVWRLRATAKGRRAMDQGRRRRVAVLSEMLAYLDAPALAVVAEAVAHLESVLPPRPPRAQEE